MQFWTLRKELIAQIWQNRAAPDTRRIPIHSDLDIVAARIEGRNLAKELGFGIIDQARIATAISELARNVLLYARHGQITLTQLRREGQVGIEILCEDRGPGIQDLDRIMAKEPSNKQRQGTGLPGTKRLMDEFEIRSQLGAGTTVVARKWMR